MRLFFHSPYFFKFHSLYGEGKNGLGEGRDEILERTL